MPEKKITYTTLLSSESIHGDFEDALNSIPDELGRHHPMYVGEEEVISSDQFEVRSPVDTDIIIGYFQKGGINEANDAINVSKKVFSSWSNTDWEERLATISATADLLESRLFPLSALITYEIGKTRFEAIAEVGEAIDMLRYYCDIYKQNNGYTVTMKSEEPGARSQSIMQPHGTWVVISPFNFPNALAAGMASAALLTGNTVVFKPTSVAPLSGIMLYHAFIEAGVPPGAINLITGPGEAFGSTVVESPDVAGIAFTGSRDVGMWLYRNFTAKQPYPKPVVSEMGSKNPCIVTASADIDMAVEGIARAAFGYGGQKCSATSRVYVQSGVADRFTDALKIRVEEMVVGDPRKREVFIGPLITQKALETFGSAVRTAIDDGGTLLTGGGILTDGSCVKGYYAQPTIVTGLPKGHSLEREELFVPFLLVQTYETIEEALAEANDTEYGLTSGIFSEDHEEIDYFFRTIRFGVCYANRRGGATTGAWPGSQPFGGWKASGSTGRGVGGPYYLLTFMREQAKTML